MKADVEPPVEDALHQGRDAGRLGGQVQVGEVVADCPDHRGQQVVGDGGQEGEPEGADLTPQGPSHDGDGLLGAVGHGARLGHEQGADRR